LPTKADNLVQQLQIVNANESLKRYLWSTHHLFT
jgi:hypothetical protein